MQKMEQEMHGDATITHLSAKPDEDWSGSDIKRSEHMLAKLVGCDPSAVKIMCEARPALYHLASNTRAWARHTLSGSNKVSSDRSVQFLASSNDDEEDRRNSEAQRQAPYTIRSQTTPGQRMFKMSQILRSKDESEPMTQPQADPGGITKVDLSESEDSEDEVPPNPAAELSMAVDPSEFSTAFSRSAAARWLNNYPNTQAEMDKIVEAEAHQEDFYTPPSTPRAVLSARADADRAAVRRLGQEHEDWTKRAAAGAARLKAAIKSDASSSWQPSQRGPPQYADPATWRR